MVGTFRSTMWGFYPMNTDVKIVLCRRKGVRQAIRLTFNEGALAKLKGSSERFREGMQLIEGELAKDLFHDRPLELTEFTFEADDADLAYEEAKDIADELLNRLKLTSDIFVEARGGLLQIAA